VWLISDDFHVALS